MAKQQQPDKEDKEHPDRPLECSECNKPISVHYTEIVGGKITHTGMCNVCPQLQRRLKGAPLEEQEGSLGEGRAGLACGECGTVLSSVKVGHLVGCSNCYDVFGNALVDEMMSSNKISPVIVKKQKSVPLHVGRTPGETQEISPSLQLIALNEALEETLKREDYEQAALLRDQIKALTEESENSNGQEK